MNCRRRLSSFALLLWPWRDLPAEHPVFVAINRLSARGLLPMTRREVDFQPDAPATVEWRETVLNLCAGYRFNFLISSDEKVTRGEFAQRFWNILQKQTPAPWPRLNSDDADGDGIPDLDDALPFTAGTTSWKTP